MLACKGFEPGLVATHGSGEYKYHPGLNTTEKAFCAQTGFHCAENPLECFNWYPWDGKNEFWLVEPKGDIDDDGKKISCTELFLVARLNEMRFLRFVQAYLLGHPECEENWTHKSSGPIHVYKGKNVSAAGKQGDYIGEGIRALLNSSLSPMKIENEGFTALVLPVRMKNRA